MSRYAKKVGNKYSSLVIALIVIIVIAMVIWFFQGDQTDNNTKTKAIEIPQQKTVPKAPHEQSSAEKNRQDSASETISAPKLKQSQSPAERLNLNVELLELETSDESFQTAVGSVSQNLLEWFQVKEVIKKFITIVNDFSQNQMLYKHRTFIQPPGKIIVNKDAKGLYLAEESYDRFRPLANAVAAIDVQKGLDLYQVFKPLFEKVYKEFAYPSKYRLEDIFMKAAASVIEAPVNTDRLSLVKHTISYKFADKKLESLNDVDKLMLRMGPENTKKIQAKLRQLVEKMALLNE